MRKSVLRHLNSLLLKGQHVNLLFGPCETSQKNVLPLGSLMVIPVNALKVMGTSYFILATELLSCFRRSIEPRLLPMKADS